MDASPLLPVIVFQMGKVGSMSVVRAIRAANRLRPVYHVHRLTDEGLALEVERARRRGMGLPSHIWESRHVRELLPVWKRRGKIPLVSMVREPVARNVSAFFQWMITARGREVALQGLSQRTIKDLRDEFLNEFDDHNVPATWFDDEMLKIFGVDVYASDFPSASGWLIYPKADVQLVVMRLESLNRCWEAALVALMGRGRVPRLTRTNQRLKGQGSDLYRRFLDEVRFPSAYLDRMYGTRYARHFYSQIELERFKKRWEGA
jgi:hypothetical protein